MESSYLNLRIRNATIEDSATLLSWWNDGSVMAHAGFPEGLKTTLEHVQQQILSCDEKKRILIIELDKQAIGEMNFKYIMDDVVSIGIKLCESSHQNKGLGKLCLSMLIHELFKMHVSKVICDTNLANVRAQHVYESLGFIKTAIHRDAWRNQVGELQSIVDYELKESDFHSSL